MPSLIFALAGSSASATRKISPNLARVVGPGLLVAVGYIDPGNWATDIAGGSGFGYALLSIVILSALIAMGFQVLVSRTALATGENLATLTARHLPRGVSRASWIAGEAAILATALAELIGGAIALRLLFGMSLISGVAVTAVGTLTVLVIARGRAERHEKIVAVLLAVVAASFVYLLFKANPEWTQVAAEAARPGSALSDSRGFMIALGILGATLMPHNLYLHSGSLAAQGRGLTDMSRAIAMRLAKMDTLVCLTVAMLINAAIMIVAAASLSGSLVPVSSLDAAHTAIGQTLGVGAAIVFAVALYAAGQSSTITGVLAGRVLSSGFASRAVSDNRRAVITRVIAAMAAIGLLIENGGRDPDNLLVLSQVILSLALPFALIPLTWLAMRRDVMGKFVLARTWAAMAVFTTGAIIVLDVYLLADTIVG